MFQKENILDKQQNSKLNEIREILLEKAIKATFFFIFYFNNFNFLFGKFFNIFSNESYNENHFCKIFLIFEEIP